MEFISANGKSQAGSLETYYGYTSNLDDAVLIIEAVKQKQLKPRMERLSSSEQAMIRSGTIFVWEENISQIRRWTDGRSWSTSRLQDDFSVYQRVTSKRKSSSPYEPKFKYDKELIKRSISVFHGKQRFHLVNYYYPKDIGRLPRPIHNSSLAQLSLNKSSYYQIDNDSKSESVAPTSSYSTHSTLSLSPTLLESIPDQLSMEYLTYFPRQLPSFKTLLNSSLCPEDSSIFRSVRSEDSRQICLLNRISL